MLTYKLNIVIDAHRSLSYAKGQTYRHTKDSKEQEKVRKPSDHLVKVVILYYLQTKQQSND